MKITIDAGHVKGYNVGVDTRYNEGLMAWTLSKLLGAELEKYGAQVFYTRDDIAKDLALESRGKTAHDNGSELFISLHSDGFTSPTARGVSVFYSNYRKLDSAGIANDLGIAVAALIGTPFRGAMTRLYGGAYPQADYYGVIRGAVGYSGERSPRAALLIEHGFHSNPNDCAWLLREDNLKKLAETEAALIARFYGLQKTEASAPPDPQGKYTALLADIEAVIKKHKGA